MREKSFSRLFLTCFRVLTVLSMLFVPLMQAGPIFASSVTSASFSGGTGTVVVGGTLYAKNGGALTLTVNTSSDTKCVDVTGAFTGHQTSSTAKSSWTFSFTAGSGDGVQNVTATARPTFNQNNCTSTPGTGTASYVLDNTGPVVTGALSPAPNSAGWNNGNVSITWSATDAGSGVASGPTPATDNVTSNTGGVTKTSTATDRLGNSGTGSVTLKLDKTAPTITGSASPAANANGWNNGDVTVSFTCSDALSGIMSCSGPTTLSSNGASQSVTGTAVDNADNSASTTVSGINIDKTPPTLSGAPTTSPNAAGWYNGNVTIHWTASDALSGIDSAPADSTISSEGTGLTASASASDKAGNSTTATSSPAVSIDKTPPNTTATAPANWNNTDVTVSLNAGDALSGVAATYYVLDGGAQQTGTSIAISSEGVHTLQFWSVDKAGNTETAKTVQVKIDKTPPTITDSKAPAPNANGWNNDNVTVTFTCADTVSGIASCTSPQTITTEGKDQPVTGTAVDNAGNSTTDPATVSIDKTPPTISAAPDRAANANGWYNDNVTVTFTCNDALSGVASCPASQTLQEGANQSASGTTTDAAGNTASATAGGINVDKTPPTLSGAATSSPNADGWYNSSVTIQWTASDALSGLDASTVPASTVITGEGDNLSAGASVSDLAGNSTGASVSGIKIDSTAPSTSASVPDPLSSGWYAGAVQVTLNAVDSLSGVDKTYYSVDDGTAQTYSGPFSHSLPGSHTITFWSVDKAGNTEDQNAAGHSITLQIDNISPTITGSRLPAANGYGWNNSAVTVSFGCDDQESGIANCSGPTTLSSDGANQSVTGTAADGAGNSASATVDSINIDQTPPTLTGAPATDPSGTDSTGTAWYNGDMTIHWTATDALSGIDSSAVPADSPITGEGRDLTASASVSDKAGNSTSASQSVNIDRTPPTISGAATTADHQAYTPGKWTNQAVTVHFSASDPKLADGNAGSGVASVTPDMVLSGEGQNQTANGTATDYASNSAGATVTDIDIDQTAPNTIANASADWTNADVTVNLTASDSLSGVSATYYILDGGAQQTGTSVIIIAEGTHTLQFWSVDKAGNVEDKTASGNSVTINIDKTAPIINHSLSPAPNAAGWNNGDVTVTFTCEDSASGVKSCTSAQTVTAESANQTVTGTAVDNAGNSNTDTAMLNIDKTPPTISAAPDHAANANGWYDIDVSISFTCDDSLSGVTSCPAPVLLSEGANRSASGAVTDVAGNTASTTLSGINIDETKPAISVSATTADSKPYNAGTWTNQSVTVHFTCSDDLSGIATCPADVTLSGDGAGQSAGGYAMDKAGNQSDTATFSGINIDKTAPTISFNGRTPANGDGWNNTDVTLTWSCTDSVSGAAANSASQTLSGEGANQSATGMCTDLARNTASDTQSGINIDKTGPSLSGAPTTSANAAGWYNGDVTIQWTASDDRSGINPATQPQNGTISGEGTGLTTAASVSDLAGNMTHATSPAVNIDRTAPKTTANAPGGWAKADVPVTLSADDNLSGVAATYYIVDGGAQQAGTSLTVSGEGTHTLEFWSVDKAGNAEAHNTATVKIDLTAPTIIHSQSPAANANGWNNVDVTVTFTCQDDLSGIASCTGPQTVTAEGQDQTVTGTAVDNAGNTAVDTASVSVDKTPPTINATASPASGSLSASGWYNADVTISFTCDDNLSGVASCPASVLLVEGANQSASGTASDAAGNTASTTLSGINIDKTLPTITGAATSSPNANGWYNGPVTIHFTCSDALSGIATCPADVMLSGDGANQSVSGTAVDKAGNSASFTVGGINIDRTKPALAPTVSPNPVVLNGTATATANATDSGSGIASQSCGTPSTSSVGSFTVTCTAADKAGNTNTATAPYTVQYAPAQGNTCLGDLGHTILQPISAASPYSTFKAGSTVPAKFRVCDAKGVSIGTAGLVTSFVLYQTQAGTVTSQISSTPSSTTGDTNFRWDSTAQQWIFNISTKNMAANTTYYYRITLNDNSTILFQFGLK